MSDEKQILERLSDMARDTKVTVITATPPCKDFDSAHALKEMDLGQGLRRGELHVVVAKTRSDRSILNQNVVLDYESLLLPETSLPKDG